jgi:putative ABC transport system permease protein
MKRFLYELTESWKIALSQMQANKTRSMLTALGVIIGIVAVTLMGTAITGISKGFDKSMSILGDDVLYVSQFPWARGERLVELPRPTRDQDGVCRDAQPPDRRDAELEPHRRGPTSNLVRNVKYGENQVSSVFLQGTTADYPLISTVDFTEGRFFNELETKSAANVCVVGYDVADALFPSAVPSGRTSSLAGSSSASSASARDKVHFSASSVSTRSSSSRCPHSKNTSARKSESDVRVKVKDKKPDGRSQGRADRADAPRARATAREEERLQHQRAAGLQEHARPSEELHCDRGPLYHWAVAVRRRDRHHEHHVRERKRANQRNRHPQALGARRRTILLQFLIESTALCIVGGLIGLLFAYVMCFGSSRHSRHSNRLLQSPS